MLEALVQVIDEADDRDREGQVGVGGRRLHHRDQAEEIRRQDEHEERAEEGHVMARAMALEHAADEAVEPFRHDLGDRTNRDSALGYGRVRRLQQRAPRLERENDQDSHRDPRADYDRWKMEDARDAVDEIDRIQKTIASAPRPGPSGGPPRNAPSFNKNRAELRQKTEHKPGNIYRS